MQIEDAHMVQLVEPAASPDITVGDVILGSLGVAGAMTLTAVLLGLLVGWFLIRRSRARGIETEHPPSIQVN